MDPSPPHSKDPKLKAVPDELLQQLHEANARFHGAKEHLEAAMNGTEYRHQQSINEAEEELRRAEQQVEEVERRIKEEMKGS